MLYKELRKNALSKFSKGFDLRDTLFKQLRSIKGVEVVAIFTEAHSGQTRVNFRSTGRVNVAKIAHYFNGGGHHNASGCTIDKNMNQAKKEVMKKVKEFL